MTIYNDNNNYNKFGNTGNSTNTNTDFGNTILERKYEIAKNNVNNNINDIIECLQQPTHTNEEKKTIIFFDKLLDLYIKCDGDIIDEFERFQDNIDDFDEYMLNKDLIDHALEQYQNEEASSSTSIDTICFDDSNSDDINIWGHNHLYDSDDSGNKKSRLNHFTGLPINKSNLISLDKLDGIHFKPTRSKHNKKSKIVSFKDEGYEGHKDSEKLKELIDKKITDIMFDNLFKNNGISMVSRFDLDESDVNGL